jgi:hypothetical protein
MSSVFISIIIGMSDKGGFPMIMNVAIGYRDKISSVSELGGHLLVLPAPGYKNGGIDSYVNKTIIIVFVMVRVRRNIDMVDPNVARILYKNQSGWQRQ